MFTTGDKLSSFTHPLVSSMRIQKNFGADAKAENVLIIETNFCDPQEDTQALDTNLMDLLLDLEDLKNEAEKRIGKFDRVDIRVH